MDILKLMIVFGVLVVMLWLKRPLYQGILGAAAAVCILSVSYTHLIYPSGPLQ